MNMQNNEKKLTLNEIKSRMEFISLHFFQMNPETVKEQINSIIENLLLLESVSLTEPGKWEKIIWEYEKKILPLNEFLGISPSKDPILQKIKNGDIKNKEVTKNFLLSLKPEKILEIFNNDIRSILSFLNRLEIKETEKEKIFGTFADQLLTYKDFKVLLLLFVQNNPKSLWKNYLTKTKLEKLIKMAQNSSPLDMGEEIVNYLLDQNYVNTTFMQNLNHMLNFGSDSLSKRDQEIIKIKVNKILTKCNYPTFEELQKIEITPQDSLDQKLEKIKWYELSGKVISMEEALNLLTLWFCGKLKLNDDIIKQIVKGISISMLKTLEIPIQGIYFVQTPEYTGAYHGKQNAIYLNSLLVTNIQKENQSFYQRLKIFITIFHEMRHAKIANDIRNNNYNIENYEMEKEKVLREYISNFYKSNYQKILSEMDARIAGLDMLSKFIETYFLKFLDKIQDEIIKELEKENQRKDIQSKERNLKIFETKDIPFSQIFDTLIQYNPSILEKHPIFQLEYHLDGKIKNFEEILLSQNDSNLTLIKDILKTRYPTLLNPVPKAQEFRKGK